MLIVDPAPGLWSPEWWIDAGIPLLGAVGSLGVAVAAIIVTFGLARRERNEAARRELAEEQARDRADRAEFLRVAMAQLEQWATAEFSTEEDFRNHARRSRARLYAASAVAGSNAPAIAGWMVDQARRCISWIELTKRMRADVEALDHAESPELSLAERGRQSWLTLEASVGYRLRRWVSSGEFDLSIYIISALGIDVEDDVPRW
ncbi:hypothetical protein HD594_000298 [Microbacterium thalassium]|uniref:Uncharacterized protein n=1 Tax=Microbacterium thalassium TaxID=362649 RepID=A0A7X0KTC8_9MICO|nr:hypothetical protein [Microbacterium thalassium]